MSDAERVAMVERAAEALQRVWPRLGIVARTVVYAHPSKREIAEVVLRAALDGEMPPELPPPGQRLWQRVGRIRIR